MLKGYSVPHSPRGTSNLVPPPPWHFVAEFLTVDFEADPAMVRSYLPSPLEPSQEPGRCFAVFADWQSCSETGGELLDPVRSQYREFILLATASYRGEQVSYCPFIYVDQDFSVARGWIQGWPKQMGSVWMTRHFGVAARAAGRLSPGHVFAGTLAVKDRRLADAAVTLETPTGGAPPLTAYPALNFRSFPCLEHDRIGEHALRELVRSRFEDVVIADQWTGPATLSFHDHARQELADFAPRRVGQGYRYTMGFTIRGVELVERLHT